MICIDCKHCEVQNSNFKCKRLKKIVAPFRNCLDKQNIKKEKIINYYLANYKTKTKAQMAKHLGWDRGRLVAFVSANLLPCMDEHTWTEK